MDFAGFLKFITGTFIKPATVLILSGAVVFFLWNIAEGIRKGDSSDERSEMKTRALWGIIAIAVMVSLWGLVSILMNTFGIRAGSPAAYPTSGGFPQGSFPRGTSGGGSVSYPPVAPGDRSQYYNPCEKYGDC